jgi:uncharacterized SAM-binding protein YcdF (DUF218 family)
MGKRQRGGLLRFTPDRQDAVLNDLFLQFGIGAWKPVLTALLLPPVPLLLLMLLGASLVRRRPAWAWLLLLAGAAGIWLSCTTRVGQALQRQLLVPSRALSPADVQQLRALPQDGAAPRTAIVVLGGGRESHAPEYGSGNLSDRAMERLRYGLWLARETGLPVAFSGGTGRAQTQGPSEAEIAAMIAAREFARPLRWTESSSRDTRENAARSVALLQDAGITRIVLVTHGWHMRRSLRAFEQAIQQRGGGIGLWAAPMGLARDESRMPLPWLPSAAGFRDTRQALHEYLGLLVGA